MNPLIQEITKKQLRDDIPDFRPGDNVRVHAKIVEGERERIQLFEGVVIKRHGVGISATYTVRQMALVWNGHSRYIHHVLKRSKLPVTAKCVGQSSTTCAHYVGKQLVSAKSVVNTGKRPANGLFF